MTKIAIRREHYPQDVTRIVEAFAKRSLPISRAEAQEIWLQFSAHRNAGWLVPEAFSDDEIVDATSDFYEVF